MKRTVPCLVIACVLGLALTSMASVKDSLVLPGSVVSGAERPIEITARKLNLKFAKKSAQAVYDGNVKVKQGEVTMSCDRLVIDYEMKDAQPGRDTRDPRLAKDVTLSNMRSITASGNVKIVQGDRMAVAGKAVFENLKRTIELSDNPKLWQGPDCLSGSKIIFYVDENRSVIDGEIRTTISPGKPKKEQEK